jgi:hypothetical protein
MIFRSFHLIAKQCHQQWHSSLFRTIVVIQQRQLATTGQNKKNSKQEKNDVIIQPTSNQVEVGKFKEKGKNMSEEIFCITILYYSSTSG